MTPRPTPEQRQLLEQAAKRGLPRPRNHQEAQILDRLWDNNWITWTTPDGRPARRARLTPHGEQALNPPPVAHTEKPVYLTHARDPHTYTTRRARAAVDAGEVLDPSIINRYTRRVRLNEQQARDLETARREQQRRPLSIDDRIHATQIEARARGVDVTRDVWMIRRLQTDGRTDQALRRLRALEARLDRLAA